MVIQCSECQTRFKLADDKLKPGGIKVRCAKCKHVFTVEAAEPAVAPPPCRSTPYGAIRNQLRRIAGR